MLHALLAEAAIEIESETRASAGVWRAFNAKVAGKLEAIVFIVVEERVESEVLL